METEIHCRRTLPIVGQLDADNAKQLMLLIVVIDEALSIFPTLCGNYVKVFY